MTENKSIIGNMMKPLDVDVCNADNSKFNSYGIVRHYNLKRTLRTEK